MYCAHEVLSELGQLPTAYAGNDPKKTEKPASGLSWGLAFPPGEQHSEN